MVSKKKQKEKKKDFQKQKLKVGKGPLKANNATDISFKAKSLNVRTQQLGPTTLKNQLSLLKHHQAVVRKQAILYIIEHMHLYTAQFSTFVSSIIPLMVDSEQQVRQTVLKFLQTVKGKQLDSFIPIVLLYIHSAMTHIMPAIRAESTLFLDTLLAENGDETIRQGFVKTLDLFITLFGFSNTRKNLAAGSMATTTMTFGKLAAKTKLVHLKSLQTLLNKGLSPELVELSDLYHPDSASMLIPHISQPYSFDSETITEDSQARLQVLLGNKDVLVPGLELITREGGESGRIASKLISMVN